MQIITEADVVWWLGVCTSGMHTPIKKIESLQKVGIPKELNLPQKISQNLQFWKESILQKIIFVIKK